MGYRLGADIGDFRNTTPPTPAQLDGLHQAGVGFIIPEFTYPDHFQPMVEDIRGAGFDMSSYNFLYWSKSDADILTFAPNSVRNHIDAICRLREAGTTLGWWRPDGTFVPQLFLDGESDSLTSPPTEPGSPERAMQIFGSAVEWARAEDLAVGIYTGEYWWKANTGNDPRLAGLPLWHASQYRQTVPIPMRDYFVGHEYGAWPVPMLWQHRGTMDVAGVSVDLDLEEWADVPAA